MKALAWWGACILILIGRKQYREVGGDNLSMVLRDLEGSRC